MYRDLNDSEMLYLICDGDDDDYEIMLKKYYPLLTKIMHKYKIILKHMGYEEDDLIQIGAMTIYQAIKYYNIDSNNLFFTYLNRSLENAYINLIRRGNNNRCRILNESISYDNYMPNSELSYIEIIPDEKTLNIEYLHEYGLRYNNLKNSLTFDFACILELKFEGYSNFEIAELLDITINEVTHGLKIIKERAIYF